LDEYGATFSFRLPPQGCEEYINFECAAIATDVTTRGKPRPQRTADKMIIDALPAGAWASVSRAVRVPATVVVRYALVNVVLRDLQVARSNLLDLVAHHSRLLEFEIACMGVHLLLHGFHRRGQFLRTEMGVFSRLLCDFT
jgi:hypothetical protein